MSKIAGQVFKRQSAKSLSKKKPVYIWGYVLDAGKDENGKRRQIRRSGFATQREAQDKLQEALQKQETPAIDGQEPARSPVTLDTLLDEYLATVEEKVTRKTFESYVREAKRVRDTLGMMALSDIDNIVVEDALNNLQKPPHSYSVKAIRNTAGVLSGAFKLAIRRTRERSAYITVNPMQGVKLPTAPRRKVEALGRQDVQKILAVALGTDLYEVIALGLATGMRRGEILGLHWPDVNLTARKITVRYSVDFTTKFRLRLKAPKSGQVRFVAIPQSLVDILTAHRQRQEAEQERARALFGKDFKDMGLVFAAPDGGLLHPDNFGARVRNLCKKAGVKVGLHAFRHQHASESLSGGASLATVSKRLGHASPAITAAIYSHGLDEDDIKASDQWEKAFGKVLRQTGGISKDFVTRM